MRFTLAILLSIFLTTTAAMGQAARVIRSSQTIVSNGQTYYMHKIARGETLEQLAIAYNVSTESILAKNPFAAKKLTHKQIILIPTEQTANKPIPKKALPQIDTVAKTVEVARIDTVISKIEVTQKGRTRDFDPNQPINIAIMLPFSEQYSSGNNNFADFYRGVLMALNELKNKGLSTNVEVITCGERNDSTSELSVQKIINSGVLDKMNLIIGPVYQENFIPIARYATENRIPIVSPLSTIEGIESPFVFQVTPAEETKFNKLHEVFNNPIANTIVFKDGKETDESMLEGMKDYSIDFQIVEESTQITPRSLTDMLDSDKDNILVVPINKEMTVSTLLHKISAINSTSKYKITVVGLPRWARFNNLSIETLFALNTHYVANYHEDRTNDLIVQFYSDYIQDFGALPSLFSMRGYDVTLMFVSALAKWGPEMPLHIDRFSPELLQVKYNFKQSSDTSNFVNQEWMLINYTPNNEIIVK